MTDRSTTDRRTFIASAAAAGAGGLLLAPTAAATSPSAQPHAFPRVLVSDIKTYRIPKAIFVEVVSDAGVSGWGESATDNTYTADALIHHGLKSRVIGEDIFDAERIWDTMFYKNHDLGPGGALTNAMSGIDCALWDLKGRLLGLPVHKLIGGAYRDRIRVYGSFGIGNDTKMPPADAAAKAAKFVGMGFTAVKCRLQIRELNLNPEPEIAFDYVRAVREAIGDDVDLLIDVNNGYTANRAISVGKRLRDEFGVMYFEDPVSDQSDREMKQANEGLDIPIIAGEKEYTRWQFADLILNGDPDVINPDVLKVGGLTEMKKIAVLAQTFHKPIIPHNTRPTLGTAASLQFVASIPNAGPLMEFPDVDEFTELMALMRTNVEFKDGFLMVPQVPGMGLDPDPDAVRAAAAA